MHAISISLVAVTVGMGLAYQGDAAKAQRPEPKPIEEDVRALFEYDREADLEIVENDYVQYDGYSQADLSFVSPGGGRVPAYLSSPDGEGPFAGLVMMHGMPGSRRDGLQSVPGYIKAGMVVIAISAPWARPDGPREDVLRFDQRDRDEQVQLIQDLMRAVDLLESLSNVDPKRMGYAGVSYGGAMGGLLAGVETRLVAYALMVGDGGLVAHMTGPEDGAGPGVPAEQFKAWVELMKPIEPIRFVAHAAPAHLLFQNGKTDELVPAADAQAYQAAASEPKTILWYDGGHGLTPKHFDDQLDWFSERIGTKRRTPK